MLSRALCFFLLLPISIAVSSQSYASDARANIIFLMDASGSVGEEAFEDEKRFVANLASSFDYRKVNVGIVRFSTGADILHSLGDTQSAIAVEAAVLGASYTKGSTFTRTALQTAMKQFDTYSGDESMRFVVLVSDGNPYPSNTQDVCDLKDDLNDRSITTLGLLVGDNINLQKLSCITDYEKLIPVKDFGALVDISSDGSIPSGLAVLRDFDLDSVLNKDELLIDTDNDGLPNYIDSDDDGDGVLTFEEDYNANGNLNDDDTDRDGIAEYLDAEVTEPMVTANAGPDQIVLDQVQLDGSASTVLSGLETASFTWLIEQSCADGDYCEAPFELVGQAVTVDFVMQGHYTVTLTVESDGYSHSDSAALAVYGMAYSPEYVAQLKKKLKKSRSKVKALREKIKKLKARIQDLKSRLHDALAD
ncbi:VWA domain-containing protein [Agaribacterium haliotis]|uniref:VWA domain-containing protein n=1 Tax=Agaribacterium haliotis TaxID=2013869 RepID=UPI000BB5868F|nr:VWA domain-containing protein [Agaribacterium haliotis]